MGTNDHDWLGREDVLSDGMEVGLVHWAPKPRPELPNRSPELPLCLQHPCARSRRKVRASVDFSKAFKGTGGYAKKSCFRAFEYEMSRMGTPECYFTSISTDLKRKRDYIAQVLRDVGMNPVIPEGGYFIMADWSKLGEISFGF